MSCSCNIVIISSLSIFVYLSKSVLVSTISLSLLLSHSCLFSSMNCVNHLIIAHVSSTMIILCFCFHSSCFFVIFLFLSSLAIIYSSIRVSIFLIFSSSFSFSVGILVFLSSTFSFPRHFFHMFFFIVANSNFSFLFNSFSILCASTSGIFSSISVIFLVFSVFSLNSFCLFLAFSSLSAFSFSNFSLSTFSALSSQFLTFSLIISLHSLLNSHPLLSLWAFSILLFLSSSSLLRFSRISFLLSSQSTISDSSAPLITPPTIFPLLPEILLLLLPFSSLFRSTSVSFSFSSSISSLFSATFCWTTILYFPSSSILLFLSFLFSTWSSTSCISLFLALQRSFLLLAMSLLTLSSCSFSSFFSLLLPSSYSLSPILVVRRGMVHLLYSAFEFIIQCFLLSSCIFVLSSICRSKADLVNFNTLIPNFTSPISMSWW